MSRIEVFSGLYETSVMELDFFAKLINGVRAFWKMIELETLDSLFTCIIRACGNIPVDFVRFFKVQ